MKQIEQPLYPKLSSIYNKILQLAIAIFLIIVVMNFWVTSRDEQQIQIQLHADHVGKMFLAQAMTSSLPYLSKQQKDLQHYVDHLAEQTLVKSVHIYSKTGRILASSQDSESIKDLFGLSAMKTNQSRDITPFVHELRMDDLQGYIRLSLHRPLLVKELSANSYSQYDIMRLLMIVTGIIGFLLTRGLNRFSRQGYRLPKAQK